MESTPSQQRRYEGDTVEEAIRAWHTDEQLAVAAGWVRETAVWDTSADQPSIVVEYAPASASPGSSRPAGLIAMGAGIPIAPAASEATPTVASVASGTAKVIGTLVIGFWVLAVLVGLAFQGGLVFSAGAGSASGANRQSSTNSIGDRVRVGDEHYVTLVDVQRSLSGFPGSLAPSPGMMAVAFLLEFEGINGDGSSYSPLYLTARDDAGRQYGIDPFGKEPVLSSSNSLRPGARVRGWVTFEVPRRSESVSLVYTPYLGALPDVIWTLRTG